MQKALYYLSSVHSQNHDTFPVTVKLLRAIFDNINKVLCSVVSGVNDLMQALAKNMCGSMTKYVGNLAAEIKVGPCVQLMNILNEMEKSNIDTRRELQDARERITLAEETKIDALSRLKKAEEQVQKMTRTSRFLPPACQKKQVEHSITDKLFLEKIKLSMTNNLMISTFPKSLFLLQISLTSLLAIVHLGYTHCVERHFFYFTNSPLFIIFFYFVLFYLLLFFL